MEHNRVLLVEPYDDLIKTLGFFLEELGFEYDVVRDAGRFRVPDPPSRYQCVLINIDQNNGGWRESGVRFAESVSRAGVPVVLIADHQADAATVEAEGWQPVTKPFTLDKLQSALSRAISG